MKIIFKNIINEIKFEQKKLERQVIELEKSETSDFTIFACKNQMRGLQIAKKIVERKRENQLGTK